VIWASSALKDEATRAEFYRAYHLEEMLKSGQLTAVSGTETDVKAAISSHRAVKGGGQLNAGNVIAVTFESEHRPSLQFSNLILKDNVLGADKMHRADFPVALLAANLRISPDRIEGMMKADALSKPVGEANTWVLVSTPEGAEFSDFLIAEIQTYQKAAEKINAAA
jgi:hypothetical protein